MVGLVMRALGIIDGSTDTRLSMILKKKNTIYLDTRARVLMEADPKTFRSIDVRNCAGKRQFENVFSGTPLCPFTSCN